CAVIHALVTVGALDGFVGVGLGGNRLLLYFDQFILALGFLLPLLAGSHRFVRLGLRGLDYVDTNLAELRQNALDLLGIDLFRRQQRVDLIVGDVAALLGGADQFLQGRVRKIEQRPIRRGLGTLIFRNFFFLRRHFECACHEYNRRR